MALAVRRVAAAADAPPIADRIPIKGVVFDMDGTLTIPCIDFKKLRQVVNIMTGDVLDTIATWPPEQQVVAYAAIAEVEHEALGEMRLMPDLHDLCKLLDDAGIPRGLITRNTQHSVNHFHTKHLAPLAPFSPALSRDFGVWKPSPQPLLHICNSWGVRPEETMMVGDSAFDDIVSGRRANAAACILLDTEGQYLHSTEELQGESQPDFIAMSLAEVGLLFSQHYQLVSPQQ
ncbi:hypothetical protein WJX72_002579 [[Myrmecia] bisecta]|uniref:Uncharacterized protein n=1 Tax=[Myrmecia] bisecta TaxID=41462 RepID=A0AAW1PB99_9CHLO